MEQNRVLAMYDVRGIQNYIFKTAKVRDAIGASAIVENIISEALRYAVKKKCLEEKAQLEWCTKDGVLPYCDTVASVQVLYIGGGNAYIICENRELCREINRIMARYIIENTYSLQLATAMVEVTGNYQKDYNKLMNEMIRVKTEMLLSKPLGALPVMAVEIKTGYPASADPEAGKLAERAESVGTESLLKLKKEREKRSEIETQIKILDNYATKKGEDSTIAVVHIDGNNMGQRIRKIIQKIESYDDAVNKMRQISWHINSSYNKVFEEMQKFFNENAGKSVEKENDNFVLKILVAGDDITYVCNGKIALATVEYYCNEITRYTMTGDIDKKSLSEYGFSVCGGVAFIGSHFPFYAGYEAAEACCESAKREAKAPKNLNNGQVGNWVDFQICKNIQARDLKDTRDEEYVTSHGEQLCLRPYCMDSDAKEGLKSFGNLKANICYFQDEKNIPRSFSKGLRNVYSQGVDKAGVFLSFLESRNWKMPDKSDQLYENIGEADSEITVAKYYDALELMDYYVDLDEIKGGKNDGTISVENRVTQ